MSVEAFGLLQGWREYKNKHDRSLEVQENESRDNFGCIEAGYTLI